jgi:hypothetical protein
MRSALELLANFGSTVNAGVILSRAEIYMV